MQMEEIKLTSVFERDQNDIFLVKKELFGEPEGFFYIRIFLYLKIYFVYSAELSHHYMKENGKNIYNISLDF